MAQAVFIVDLACSCVLGSLAFSMVLSFALSGVVRNKRVLERICISNFLLFLTILGVSAFAYYAQPARAGV